MPQATSKLPTSSYEGALVAGGLFIDVLEVDGGLGLVAAIPLVATFVFDGCALFNCSVLITVSERQKE